MPRGHTSKAGQRDCSYGVGYGQNRAVNSRLNWWDHTPRPRLRTLGARWFRVLTSSVTLSLALEAAASIEWQGGEREGFRVATVAPAVPGRTGFRLLTAAETGILFTNSLAQSRYVTNQIYLNGAGVAAGDVDGDGRCDLYFCGLDRPNALYRNLGNWRFEDVTERAGVALAEFASTGAAFADLDGDGDLDLVVNTVGEGTWVLRNDGQARFVATTPGRPLNYLRGGMSLGLADIDGDGDLDLYVANYRTTTLRDMPNTRLTLKDLGDRLVVTAMDGRPATDADLVGRFTVSRDHRIRENGEADVLYLNDGQGGFSPVSFTGGSFLDEDGQLLQEPPYDWSLTAAFRDLNGDLAPDLYVCGDFESPDRIWLNNGRGQFRALDRLALRCTSIFSMGIDFADVNRDGWDDFFVSDMLSRDHARRMLETGEIQPVHLPLGAIANRPQYSRNTLLVNRGDVTYAELAQFAGVQASEWTWSPNFLDVDLDGFEDLLITTGHELQMMNGDIINQAEAMKSQKQMSAFELQRLRTLFPRYSLPNVAFRNRGDLTFEDVSALWGFNVPDVGNALALADLDNDGDLDAVVNNLNGPAELYRNEGAAPRLAVRLKGSSPNTQGIGAKIAVTGGPVPRQTQEIMCGGRYLSGNEALRTFAAGSLTNRLAIEVHWRSGRRSLVTNALPNRVYEIAEAAANKASQPFIPEADDRRSAPWFEDASDRLGHRHHEDPFDDFSRQPLLANRLSQLGPGISWLDFDGDGWDDLVIPSGRGGALGCYRNQTDGAFARQTDGVLGRLVGRDQTVALGLGPVLLVGSSNYEDGTTNGGCIRIYDLARQAAGDSILGHLSSTGPLALADVDQDGDLDLFVGGRVLPGRYPEPATSLFLRNEGGRLAIDQVFERLGLVSGALFSDLDGDGTPELVLACEWGPVRIFRHERGRFSPWDPPVRWRATAGPGASSSGAPAALPAPGPLSALTGWWAGVAAGDLDGDGRLDLVVSNWGLNSRYRPTTASPVWVRYSDLSGSGGVDVIETYLNPATGKEVPRRGLRSVLAALPFVQETITSLAAYGQATVHEIYGERLATAGVVEATTLLSMVFFNRGDRLEAMPLPDQAQWAPAFGVCIADLDGDGAEDVFLSQNFFAVNPDDWRQDAGRGLLLRGDGRGGLAAVPGTASGLKIYGEQRGCAVSDYDRDGRVDLAVTQNGAPTRLFRNVHAQPGLRIRLLGPPANPHAIGATLRLQAGERSGPARELQAGAGYWSHNSVVSVLSLGEEPTHLWVRWPGGRTTTSPLPPEAREVALAADGSVRVTLAETTR